MRREHLPIVIFVGAVVIGVTLLAPLTWAVLLDEGLLALALLLAAAGWGAWPTAWLGFRNHSPRQQWCLATTLGLGLLSVFTLILGTTGLLSRPTAWMLLAIGGAAGLWRLYRGQSERKAQAGKNETKKEAGQRPPVRPAIAEIVVQALLLLALAIPLSIALFGAALPPGTLWQEEARGYDVLEYHLQGPREYYDAGRVTFLPHNVYTSFPQQMEMLYLLLMHLAGGAYAAAIPAQLLHAACGILAVVALACWTRPGWPRWLVALLAGSTPWLAYLGCLAYVENGMLFFAAVAVGLIIERESAGTAGHWRAILAAGICVGLAGGCKYTALIFVGLALALACLITMRASLVLRVRRIAVFSAGALLAFSPWLIRNAAFTGNPVYPFAYEWLGGKAWSDEQARQWTAGHRVPPERDTIVGRLTIAAHELFGTVSSERAVSKSGPTLSRTGLRPARFGQVLFVLAAAGIVLGRSRHALLLAVWTVLIVVAWITLTFIPGRFAVPLIVPLALLGGTCIADEKSRLKWPVLFVALGGALINGFSLTGQLRAHDAHWRATTKVPLSALVGQTRIFVDGHPLAQELDANAHAWLVGDAAVFYIDRQIHYTVPFSRDPWIEFAATADARQCLNWLRDRDVSHVVFSWSEIDRLRRTYGFSNVVTRDWVSRLEQAGLRLLQAEQSPVGGAPVEIYEVPAALVD